MGGPTCAGDVARRGPRRRRTHADHHQRAGHQGRLPEGCACGVVVLEGTCCLSLGTQVRAFWSSCTMLGAFVPGRTGAVRQQVTLWKPCHRELRMPPFLQHEGTKWHCHWPMPRHADHRYWAMQGLGAVPVHALESQAADAHAHGGAVQAMSDLAAAAARLGVAVDVLAAGGRAVNAPLLGTLTRQTGGSLTLHAGAHAGCVACSAGVRVPSMALMQWYVHTIDGCNAPVP